jgi:hypothetical protein
VCYDGERGIKVLEEIEGAGGIGNMNCRS